MNYALGYGVDRSHRLFYYFLLFSTLNLWTDSSEAQACFGRLVGCFYPMNLAEPSELDSPMLSSERGLAEDQREPLRQIACIPAEYQRKSPVPTRVHILGVKDLLRLNTKVTLRLTETQRILNYIGEMRNQISSHYESLDPQSTNALDCQVWLQVAKSTIAQLTHFETTLKKSLQDIISLASLKDITPNNSSLRRVTCEYNAFDGTLPSLNERLEDLQLAFFEVFHPDPKIESYQSSQSLEDLSPDPGNYVPSSRAVSTQKSKL